MFSFNIQSSDSGLILKNNIKQFKSLLNDVIITHKRSTSDVSLLIVTKNQQVDSILIAFQDDNMLFGENRVQEAQSKFISTPSLSNIRKNLELHLIGTLQKNKIKKAIDIFDCIESVDSLDLIKELSLYLNQINIQTKYPIFLQVKSSDLDNKHGFDNYNILKSAIELVLNDENLILQGLMTIAPFTTDEKIIRNAFSKTRIWKEKLEQEYNITSLKLSMGMSNDYHYAIEEGSNIVRIGTAIFGNRS